MSQTQTKVLKNGIPSFDAYGYATMLPTDKVTKPFGFAQKTISFQEAPGGATVMILISDIGAYPVATGFSPCGLMGLCCKYNYGYVDNGLGIAVINAIASHRLDSNAGLCLSSTHPLITPFVAKYNGHAYVGIKIQGNTGTLTLVGQAYNLLGTPIILNDRDGMNTANAEILAESPSQPFANWGGVISSFSEANKASARISKKGGMLHEYIDNYADKGSHQCGAEGNILGCARLSRRGHRRGRDKHSWGLSPQSIDNKSTRTCGQIWRSDDLKSRRFDAGYCMAMAERLAGTISHEVPNLYASVSSDNHNAYHVALGKEVAA